MTMTVVLSVVLYLGIGICTCLDETWTGAPGVKRCDHQCSIFRECKTIVYVQTNFTCGLVDCAELPVVKGSDVQFTGNLMAVPERARVSVESSGTKTCVIPQSNASCTVCALTNSPNKNTRENKAPKRTRQLAALTWTTFSVMDMSTYKTIFAMRRPRKVFEIQYDEYGHRLYWMSWGHPPSIGYFHGPRYRLKALIVKKEGNQITNFGVSLCRIVFCYNNDLHWATPDGDMHSILTTRLRGPIMMHLQRGTVYAVRDLHKKYELTEFTFDGKIERTAEIKRTRIAYDNKNSIYLPYSSKGIWKVSIETWSNVRLNISTPYKLLMTTVRHDRMVLLGIKEMYVYDENLNFLKKSQTYNHLMGAALMV